MRMQIPKRGRRQSNDILVMKFQIDQVAQQKVNTNVSLLPLVGQVKLWKLRFLSMFSNSFSKFYINNVARTMQVKHEFFKLLTPCGVRRALRLRAKTSLKGPPGFGAGVACRRFGLRVTWTLTS